MFPLKRQKSGFYKKINLFLRNVISQLNNLTRAISRKVVGAVCLITRSQVSPADGTDTELPTVTGRALWAGAWACGMQALARHLMRRHESRRGSQQTAGEE